jgi:hypothetical protein
LWRASERGTMHRNRCPQHRTPPSTPAVLRDNAASTGPCGAGPARDKTTRIKHRQLSSLPLTDGVHPPCTCSVAMPVTITTAQTDPPLKRTESRFPNAGAHLHPPHRSSLPPPAALSFALLLVRNTRKQKQKTSAQPTSDAKHRALQRELPKPHASSSSAPPSGVVAAATPAARPSLSLASQSTSRARGSVSISVPSLNCAAPGALTATRPVLRLQICGGTHGVNQIGCSRPESQLAARLHPTGDGGLRRCRRQRLRFGSCFSSPRLALR